MKMVIENQTKSWTEVLINLKDRGFKASKLAVSDGALGFWKTVRNFYSNP